MSLASELEKAEPRRLLDALSPLRFDDRQRQLHDLGVPGTGGWFLHCSEVQQWINSSKQTLFCSGIAGSGKTILATQLVEHLQTTFKDNRNTGIAYLYLNSQEKEQRPEALIGSIIQQLLRQLNSIPASVWRMYNQYRPHWSSLSLEQISILLDSTLDALGKTFVTIDGLDELPGLHSRVLIDVFFKLQEVHELNIFATARPELEILQLFRDKITLQIKPSEQHEDLRTFVKARLSSFPSSAQMPPELRQTVIEETIKRADGK